MQPPALMLALPPEVMAYVQSLQEHLNLCQQERGILLRTVEQLHQELQQLRQHNADLEALQAITTEHSDLLQEQLYHQATALNQVNQDLRLLLETATAHGDSIGETFYEAQHRYRTILDNTLGGIGQMSLEGSLIGANVALTRMLGYDQPKELVQQHWPDLMVNPEGFAAFWQQLCQTGIVVGWELQMQRRDGEILWVSLSARLVTAAKGDPAYYEFLLENITARKNVERLKDEFISTISHELRTPLTGIQGALGLVVNGVAGEVAAPAQALLSMALQCGERLSRLINDLLDLEHIEAGRLTLHSKRQPLLSILQEALAAMSTYAATYHVRVEWDPLPSQPLADLRVNVDADRLQQVFAHLLSNAIKFSPPQSTVRVALQEVTVAGVCIARVSIQDQGVGIPEALRPHLFQKFVQGNTASNRQHGGIGLGLTLSKALVEQMGGQIHFESHLGQGTTFYVDFPL